MAASTTRLLMPCLTSNLACLSFVLCCLWLLVPRSLLFSSAASRKKNSHVDMSIYWSRGAVGLKLPVNGKKVQKFYFSANYATIGVNILLATKMATYLKDKPVDFADSEESRKFYGKLVVAAGAAHDRFVEVKANKETRVQDVEA